jgi:hypothetical protein
MNAGFIRDSGGLSVPTFALKSNIGVDAEQAGRDPCRGLNRHYSAPASL